MIMIIGRMTLGLAMASMCAIAAAADGDLDTTFGADGFRLTGASDANSSIPAGMAMQPDGKIVICNGEGTSSLDYYVARFTADGDLDTTFSFDGKTTIDFDGNNDTCVGLAVQDDGKIVVAGTTVPQDNNADFAVARLNADGTLDLANFGNGTGKSVVAFDLGNSNGDYANSVALRPSGKIVVAGSAATLTDGADFAILQLNTDGSRDTSFNLTGRVTVGFDFAASPSHDDSAVNIAIDAGGRIVAAGNASVGTTGQTDFAVIRLLPNGQLDPDFSADGRATVAFDLGGATGGNGDGVYSVALLRGGKILLGGVADSSTTASPNEDMALVRMLPDGSLDAGFGLGGRTTVAFDLEQAGPDLLLAAAEQSNGRLVLAGAAVGGVTGAVYAAAARLTPDGSPDAGFGTLGKKTYDFEQTVPSGQLFNGIGFQGNQIVFAGAINVIDTLHVDLYAARVQIDLIFADGFE